MKAILGLVAIHTAGQYLNRITVIGGIRPLRHRAPLSVPEDKDNKELSAPTNSQPAGPHIKFWPAAESRRSGTKWIDEFSFNARLPRTKTS